MIKNSSRRAFIKKSLSLLCGVPLYGCGGSGSGSSNATPAPMPLLPVLPFFLTQPSDQSVSPSESATFQVLADGSPPPSYQWLRDGQPISGATKPSYITPLLTLGDDAIFSATITNLAGSVTSLPAELTIIAETVTVDSTTITADSIQLTADNI